MRLENRIEIRVFQPLNVHAAALSYRKVAFTKKLRKIFATHLQNKRILNILIVQAMSDEGRSAMYG